MEVLAEAIGVQTIAAPFLVVLPAGKTLPGWYSAVFSTSQDDQPAATVRLVAGDPSPGGATRFLGELVVPDLPPGSPGSLHLRVCVEVDEEGSVRVSARHPRTGAVVSAPVGAVAVSQG